MTTRLPALECLCQRTGAVRLTTRVLNFFWLHAALSPISTNESDGSRGPRSGSVPSGRPCFFAVGHQTHERASRTREVPPGGRRSTTGRVERLKAQVLTMCEALEELPANWEGMGRSITHGRWQRS